MNIGKTGSLSWGRNRAFRAAALTAFLLVFFCPITVLHAADVVAITNSPSQTTVTAALEYQETPYSVMSWRFPVALQRAPFKKEPVEASRKIVRGILNFPGDPQNAIPFLWLHDVGKLYFDQNRNQDLTDDPDGIFFMSDSTPIYYQTFTNVCLPLTTALGARKVFADINIIPTGLQPFCSLEIRSFWQGKVTLHGKDWHVGLVQNDFTRNVSFERGHLLFRPWENRDKPFNIQGGFLDAIPFESNFFADGHAYHLTWTAEFQNGEIKPALQFAEQPVALGELKFTGKYIQRAVFSSESYVAICDDPTGMVKIPSGIYSPPKILIQQGGARAVSMPKLPHARDLFNVSQTPSILPFGGPLRNSVSARRHGQDLILDYSLIGGGDMTYRLAGVMLPEYAIYKDDIRIATGTFEFG